MRTVGVDLAAADERTAVAVVDWADGRAVVADLRLGVSDADVVAAALGADKTGIDCALGWPEPFTRMLLEHRTGHASGAPGPGEGAAWRRAMVYRTTDEAIRAEFGLIPLSVSADRLAHAAMRCAGILSRLAAAGADVDRAGGGAIVEAYPAAALRRWGLTHRGYKGRHDPLVDDLAGRGWLTLGGHEPLMRASHDAFDAVIAALVARASALGRATRPGDGQAELARIEGWIAVPTLGLDALKDQPIDF